MELQGQVVVVPIMSHNFDLVNEALLLDRGSAVKCRLLVQICNLVAHLVWILCTCARREYPVTNSRIKNLFNNSSSIRVMIEHIQDLSQNYNLLKFDVSFWCPLYVYSEFDNLQLSLEYFQIFEVMISYIYHNIIYRVYFLITQCLEGKLYFTHFMSCADYF